MAEIVKDQTNVYLMRFTYVGTTNPFPCNSLVDYAEFCREIEADRIVSHLDDLNYLLTSAASAKVSPTSTADARIVEKYTTLLANFAKTG